MMCMALDFRLAALKDAIDEGWMCLEAEEVDGALVIRVRKGAGWDAPD